jgi:hypothetical protein
MNARDVSKFVITIALSVIAAMAFVQCAKADEFNDTEIIKESIWQVVNVIDWGQTRDIARTCGNSDRVEYNPALSTCPTEAHVNRYFIVSALAHVGISRWLGRENRGYWQNVTLYVSGGIVLHNYSIGLKVDF